MFGEIVDAKRSTMDIGGRCRRQLPLRVCPARCGRGVELSRELLYLGEHRQKAPTGLTQRVGYRLAIEDGLATLQKACGI